MPVSPAARQPAAPSERSVQEGDAAPAFAAPAFAALSSAHGQRQAAQRRAIDASPAMAAQRARIRRAFGPAPGGAPVQRLTFKIERRDSESEAAEKQQHIDAQDARLNALQTLYVDDAGGSAMENAGPTHTIAATRQPGQQASRGDKLHDAWYVKYQSTYHVYTISLVTSGDHDPRGDDPVVGAVRRIHEPFAVLRFSTLGQGGDIGRTLSGGWAWSPNPAYEGTINAPNLGGQFHPTAVPPQALPSLLSMPPDKRLGEPGTEGYVPLPAPRTQPFVYYKDPAVSDPTHRHDERRELPPPSASLSLFGSGGPAPGVWSQSTFSQPPQTARKGGGRDPGTAMGGPASALVHDGWSAEPKRGVQASHEWCHLVGDGDGGACAGLNLVIGTNQVNSEQLALENGLRLFRSAFDKLGYGIYIDARATGAQRPQTAPDEEPVFEADWIKYAISVRPLKGGGEHYPVHTEVMDATRGTITKGEFNALRSETELRIRTVLRQLQGPSLFDVPHGGVWPSDPHAQQHPHLQHNQELFRGSPSFPGTPAPYAPPADDRDADGFRRPAPRAGRYNPYPSDPQSRRASVEQRAWKLVEVALDGTASEDARDDARRALRQLRREITDTDLQHAIRLALQR